MTDIARSALQAVAYIAFAYCIASFATTPVYRYADPAMAGVKLSLSHAADRVEPCVPLTPEQIAEFARNMRRTEACVRERLPLIVELDVDGETVISLIAGPSGLWDDGPASVYERFELPPGSHTIAARLRDTARTDGWDYESTAEVDLQPGRYFVVSFKASTGRFSFR